MTALQIFEMFPTADRLYQIGTTEFFLSEQEADDFCKHFNRKDGFVVVEREEEAPQSPEAETGGMETGGMKESVGTVANKKPAKSANTKATPGPKVLIEPVEGATPKPKINPDASVEE